MARLYLALESDAMLEMMGEFLAAYGHEVRGATTKLPTALEEIRAQHASLDGVVLDVPADAESLLCAVEELRRLSARLNIVVISEEYRLAPKVIRAGADEFLERPFQLQSLLRAIPPLRPFRKGGSAEAEQSVAEYTHS